MSLIKKEFKKVAIISAIILAVSLSVLYDNASSSNNAVAAGHMCSSVQLLAHVVYVFSSSSRCIRIERPLSLRASSGYHGITTTYLCCSASNRG